MLLLASSLFCLIYGLFKYLNKKAAMFSILIVGAITCFMMGHLYDTITLLILKTIPSKFNIGMLARIGGYGFFFSASFAQMDGLADDGSEKLIKYRFIALIAPILICSMYIPILIMSITSIEKACIAVIFLFAALSVYFNFKHLIIPDVAFGIIKSNRLYNLFEIISAFLYCGMLLASKCGFFAVKNVLSVLLAISYPCVVIAMEKGRLKWIA